MENVTIKQLLDAGAHIKISLHNQDNEQGAVEKIRSIGYDGELVTEELDEGTVVVTNHGNKLWISAFYDKEQSE